MTATRPDQNDADTGVRDKDGPVPNTSGWMVDVATHRVFRVTPKGGTEETPVPADRETGEGEQA